MNDSQIDEILARISEALTELAGRPVYCFSPKIPNAAKVPDLMFKECTQGHRRVLSGLRKSRNLTQTDLGKLLGVRGANISQWERGASIAERHVEKMMEIFQVDRNSILSISI